MKAGLTFTGHAVAAGVSTGLAVPAEAVLPAFYGPMATSGHTAAKTPAVPA